tara:strand:+ start:113 stop:352 length:240 start_codon:yes stop_codon:yes gene_type:complete
MRIPKLPSFFKSPIAKSFSFKPRYYDPQKERRKTIKQKEKTTLEFKRLGQIQTTQKGRQYRIIFLIFILSLLMYKLLIS